MLESNEILSTKMGRNNANYTVNNTNILGYHYNHFCILLSTNCSGSMQCYDFQSQHFWAHVPQLPHLMCQFF